MPFVIGEGNDDSEEIAFFKPAIFLRDKHDRGLLILGRTGI